MTTQLLSQVPKSVRVVEVGPRDGLQNEAVIVATDDKARFVARLADAGLKEIEVSSFVSPKWVPQVADAAELFARIVPTDMVRHSALVPNARGLERALASGVRAIALFTAASEAFTQKNMGMTIAQSLDGFRALMPAARTHGLWVRAYVSTAFYCPYEGKISPRQVLPVVGALLALGVDEIALSDTVGLASPTDVAALTEAVLPTLPLEQTAYHFHDTNGLALANVLTALQFGVSVFDASTGGAGGCPYAPGATGNLATEDLLVLLHGMGIDTGVDLEKILDAARYLESKLGRRLSSRQLSRC